MSGPAGAGSDPAPHAAIVAQWCDIAEGDMSTARREIAIVDNPNLRAVAFHAQQAAEKLMKAILIKLGANPPKTHDLGRLAQMLRDSRIESGVTAEELGTLTMTMTFDIRFRGDVHQLRDAPGETPAPSALAFNHSLRTSGTYEFSGRYEDPQNLHYTEEWSGSGTLASYRSTGGSSSLDNAISLVGTISEGKWDMNILAFATKGNHVPWFQPHWQRSGKYVWMVREKPLPLMFLSRIR